MALLGVIAHPEDKHLPFLSALEREPTLVIDCTKYRRTFARTPLTHNGHGRAHAIEVDTPNGLRSIITDIPHITRTLGIRTILITALHTLRTDEPETSEGIEHAWILLSTLGTQYTVIVSVHPDHEHFAQKYCNSIVRLPLAV